MIPIWVGLVGRLAYLATLPWMGDVGSPPMWRRLAGVLTGGGGGVQPRLPPPAALPPAWRWDVYEVVVWGCGWEGVQQGA